MPVRRLRDGEAREERVETIGRQAWDDLFGEGDRVEDIDVGQGRAVLPLVLNPPLPEEKGIPGSGCLLELRSRRSCALGTS
ncbi:hypothetical protein ACWCOW_38160, partial [Streptomyces sp. NPDC001939]